MTAPVLQLPVKVLRSATAGRRPGDGTFRALTDGEIFINTQDRVLCYLGASGALLTIPFDPAFFAALAPVASPALTGTPTAPTPGAGDNSTRLSTTAYADAAVAAEKARAQGVEALKASLASPAFTGSPTAPTAATGDNSTLLATTAFVAAGLAALVNSSPAALDTLKELADAIGDDPNYAATVATALGNRLRVDAAQSLTAAAQQQARTNMGLGGVGQQDGCCILTMASSTSLLLSAKNGSTILVNGVPFQIPSGGITYSASNLTVGTGYYVYLNPAGALELFTTTYALDAAGRANKTGDATRRLVGWTRYGTGSTFLQVANYFNRTLQAVASANLTGTSPSTGSTSQVALIGTTFFSWADETVQVSVSGNVVSGAAQTVNTAIFTDQAQAGTLASSARAGNNTFSAASQVSSVALLADLLFATEGWHQSALYGSVSTGAAATFNLGLQVMTRC